MNDSITLTKNDRETIFQGVFIISLANLIASNNLL